MKFDLSARAERDVERIGAWWQEHRDVGAEPFYSELEAAEAHLKQYPESGRPWRRRKGHWIQRWRLERTHYHIYYVYYPDQEQLWVLTIWGEVRRDPKL